MSRFISDNIFPHNVGQGAHVLGQLANNQESAKYDEASFRAEAICKRLLDFIDLQNRELLQRTRFRSAASLAQLDESITLVLQDEEINTLTASLIIRELSKKGSIDLALKAFRFLLLRVTQLRPLSGLEDLETDGTALSAARGPSPLKITTDDEVDEQDMSVLAITMQRAAACRQGISPVPPSSLSGNLYAALRATPSPSPLGAAGATASNTPSSGKTLPALSLSTPQTQPSAPSPNPLKLPGGGRRRLATQLTSGFKAESGGVSSGGGEGTMGGSSLAGSIASGAPTPENPPDPPRSTPGLSPSPPSQLWPSSLKALGVDADHPAPSPPNGELLSPRTAALKQQKLLVVPLKYDKHADSEDGGGSPTPAASETSRASSAVGRLRSPGAAGSITDASNVPSPEAAAARQGSLDAGRDAVGSRRGSPVSASRGTCSGDEEGVQRGKDNGGEATAVPDCGTEEGAGVAEEGSPRGEQSSEEEWEKQLGGVRGKQRRHTQHKKAGEEEYYVGKLVVFPALPSAKETRGLALPPTPPMERMRLLIPPEEAKALYDAGLAAASSCFSLSGGEAEQLLSEMEELGISADLASYNAALTACGPCGDVAAAGRIYMSMASAGVCPNNYSVSMVLQACNFKRRGRWREAVEAIRVYEDLSGNGIDADLLSQLLDICEAAMHRAGSHFEAAEEVFAELQSMNLADCTRAYNALLKTAAKSGRWREAQQYFATMAADDIPATLDTVSFLIEACVSGRALGHALDAFEFLVSGRSVGDPVPANTQTYNLLIHACHQAGMLEKALEISTWASAAGVPFDDATYEELMATVSIAQLWDEKAFRTALQVKNARAVPPSMLRPAPFDAMRISYLDHLKELQGEEELARTKLMGGLNWVALSLTSGSTSKLADGDVSIRNVSPKGKGRRAAVGRDGGGSPTFSATPGSGVSGPPSAETSAHSSAGSIFRRSRSMAGGAALGLDWATAEAADAGSYSNSREFDAGEETDIGNAMLGSLIGAALTHAFRQRQRDDGQGYGSGGGAPDYYTSSPLALSRAPSFISMNQMDGFVSRVSGVAPSSPSGRLPSLRAENSSGSFDPMSSGTPVGSSAHSGVFPRPNMDALLGRRQSLLRRTPGSGSNGTGTPTGVSQPSSVFNTAANRLQYMMTKRLQYPE